MINIGSIAKTYGMLPSEVVQRANTFDLMITDVMSSWENYHTEKALGKNPTPDLDVDTMQGMIEKVRNGS